MWYTYCGFLFMCAQNPSFLDLASVKSLLSTCDGVSWFLEGTPYASLLVGEVDSIIAAAEDLTSQLDTSKVRKQRGGVLSC